MSQKLSYGTKTLSEIGASFVRCKDLRKIVDVFEILRWVENSFPFS